MWIIMEVNSDNTFSQLFDKWPLSIFQQYVLTRERQTERVVGGAGETSQDIGEGAIGKSLILLIFLFNFYLYSP